MLRSLVGSEMCIRDRDVEVQTILCGIVPVSPSVPIADDAVIYPTTAGDPPQAGGNNSREDSTTTKEIRDMRDKAPTPIIPLPPTHSNTPLSPTITPTSIRMVLPRTTKEGDQMDPVVTPQTRRRHNVLRTHLPSTTITGGITAADIIGLHKPGEMVETTSSPTGAIMASTVNNAKEARNKISNNSIDTMPIIMRTPSIKYSRRKHSNNQIDMKGPRESRRHTIRISRTYQY